MELTSSGAMAYHYLGLELGAAGGLELARLNFEKALQYMPYFARSALNLQLCDDARRGLVRTAHVILLFRAANILTVADSAEALKLCDRVIKENSDYAPAFLFRGRIHALLKNRQRALKDMTAAIQLAPGDFLSYYFRGRIFASLGQTTRAIADFTHSLQLEPGFAAARLERGKAYFQKNDYSSAVADFDLALRAWSKWGKDFIVFSAYLNRGIENNERSHHKLALLHLNRAINLNPRFGEAYLNRGIAHLGLEHFREAVSDFDLAVQKGQNSAEVYYQRGLAEKRLGRRKQAMADQQQAIALDSTHTLAHFALGEAYEFDRDYKSALDAFTRVTILGPSDEWAHYRKAIVADKLKTYSVARGAYLAFLKIAPVELADHRAFARHRIRHLQAR